MLNGTLQRAGELSPQDKQTVEALLGRALHEDESVRIEVLPPISPAEERSREAAWQRLAEFSDRIAERVKDIPEAEIDAAIDEAREHVRHTR